MAKFDIPDPRIFELSPLGYAYSLLIEEGWAKPKALYMAWKAHPRELREEAGLPETQTELFTQVLNYASDNVVRQWRRKWNGRDEDHPDMEQRIESLVRQGPLSHYRPKVLHALAESAATASHLNHSDRKLFLEMAGDYKPGVDITSGGDRIETPVIYLPDKRTDGSDGDPASA